MRSYLTFWGALVALLVSPGLRVVPQHLYAQSRDAALIQTLHHGQDPEARRQAAIRISKLDVTVALEPLMKALLADRSPIVRAACADALATLGTPAALSALRAATHDENAGVKQKAEAAVDKLTNAKFSSAKFTSAKHREVRNQRTSGGRAGIRLKRSR